MAGCLSGLASWSGLAGVWWPRGLAWPVAWVAWPAVTQPRWLSGWLHSSCDRLERLNRLGWFGGVAEPVLMFQTPKTPLQNMKSIQTCSKNSHTLQQRFLGLLDDIPKNQMIQTTKTLLILKSIKGVGVFSKNPPKDEKSCS